MKNTEEISCTKQDLRDELYLDSDDTVINQKKVNPMYGGKAFNNVVSLQVKNNSDLSLPDRLALVVDGMEEQNFCERVLIEKLERRIAHVEAENVILRAHLYELLIKKDEAGMDAKG